MPLSPFHYVENTYNGYNIEVIDYKFTNFFHPLVGELIAKIRTAPQNTSPSVAGVCNPTFLSGLTTDFFTTDYGDETSSEPGGVDVTLQYFPKSIETGIGGPYSVYNWELFYFIPITVAVHLSSIQRFAEAQNWFHLVFNPMSVDQTVAAPERFWNFLAFRQESGTPYNLEQLLTILSTPTDQLSTQDQQTQQNVLKSYQAVCNSPFQPHLVAASRQSAYQYYVVMKYLDNLISWGDSLFLQDTIETVNEATLCYVLAANLLGPRPQSLPPNGTASPKSFYQLQSGLDAMGNALIDLESQFPFNLTLSGGSNTSASQNSPLFGIGQTLYFCVPRNQTLLAYWDTVADRLFKIRNGENIAGVVSPLPLFDPPIDPGMLVKAAAAGLDVASIVSGLSQPVSPVRSTLLIQKALEITAEVKSLGGALLSALEKGDAESLALLRQGHEVNLQQLTQNVRFLQWKQAQESTQSLLRTRASAVERYKYYLRLFGQTPDSTTVPDTFSIDPNNEPELTEDNFDDVYSQLVGQYDLTVAVQSFPQLKLAGGNSPSNQSGATGSGQLFLNTNEDTELNTLLPTARDTRLAANAVSTIAAVVTLIPEFNVHLAFWGIGGASKIFGGSKLADELKIGSEILQTVATYNQDQAGIASRTAGYQRRADDWMLQANLAARELMQIGRQIIGSLINEQVTYHEYTLTKTQVQQAQDVQNFLQTKFTNADFYGWMQGQLSATYYQYYRFAVDTARKAEQTMKQELMRPELDATEFIQYNYWDSGHQGLLSGEALHLDLKRMEMAYHDNNKRELELTRHISLRQLDPLALLQLKTTGSCTVTIPEWLLDRWDPGHYMRRIKSVALSLPSVVGPYTNVSCTLALQSSTVRISSLLEDGVYGRDPSNEDDRFQDYFGAAQTIVTSGAVNDSGMFETNLKDERFLPFEGQGAVSKWTLTLPSVFPSFDFMTISDAIIHIRFTARDGGSQLGQQAMTELQQALATVGQSQLALLFSLRYDFPTEWAAFVNAIATATQPGSVSYNFNLLLDYFPYLAQSVGALTIDSLTLYSQDGQKLVQKAQASPASAVLSSASPQIPLSFPADSKVLTGDPEAQVFLVIQYHLGN